VKKITALSKKVAKKLVHWYNFLADSTVLAGLPVCLSLTRRS